MIIDTNGFEIGDEVWIPSSMEYKNFSPRLYGKCLENDGFALSVLLNERKNFMEWICHSNCFHTEQECQLACDKLNLKTEITN